MSDEQIRKFRPYLSLPELEILFCALMECSSKRKLDPEEHKLMRYLERYTEQIKLGHIRENISTRPPKPLKPRSIATLMELYSDTAMQGMSIEEVKAVTNYRFNEGLMSQEELDAHLYEMFPT